ncbi:TPA: hypothetical protein QCN45_003548 [Bacillus cereus]|uniref:hypothetical protein n=1 Tax=Bacillus cereus TaxID=1396 RepID=UPI0028AB638F|nr:hypothetical protein [Bacillus cereus]WNN02547.1 hypothetical protein RPB93_27630 [Bacillus cereus]HDR3345752.1 hypothetical protein [Bacillus cereus]
MGAFDFQSFIYTLVGIKEEIQQNIKDTIVELEKNDSLDSEVRGNARKKQGLLRSYLFIYKKTCNCENCPKEFPIDILVAAHIKKRALCTTEERLDIEHIAIPMYKFNCDELFERGYISISDGRIVSLVDERYFLDTVKRYIETINGKVCGS